MNADEIKRLREIAGKARARGPLQSIGSSILSGCGHVIALCVTGSGPGDIDTGAPTSSTYHENALAEAGDAAAFVDAHNALPALLDRLDVLEAESARLRAVANAVPAVIAEADRETVSFQNLRRALAALDANGGAT